MTVIEHPAGPPADQADEDGISSHVWVELIAFDVCAPDLGTAAYLSELGHLPQTLSLLVYSAEFLHGHVDGADDAPLPVECTSYGARPRAARGPRQDWTQGQVRRLVTLLTDRGVLVLFAVFDLHGYPTPEGRRLSRYAEAHPELTVIDRTGHRRVGMINPLGRCDDGRWYADWFLSDLARVLDFYGFSGWHAADGFISTRIALWDGDFGVAFVAGFAETHPDLVPASLLIDDAPEQVGARAELIWDRHRIAWVSYHAERLAALWSAAAVIVHERGGIVVANNGWTRDPFESLYRYGSDYDQMVRSGIDAVVLESSAGAIQLIEEDRDAPILPWITAAVMLGRLHLGRVPARPLIGVHDWYEGWDVIGDARPLLQRDLWTLTTPRRVDADGVSRRCVSGLLWCLADSIEPQQWRWLEQQRAALGPIGFAEDPAPTLVYDPATVAEQLTAFVRTRAASPGRLLERVLRRGGDLVRVASAEVALPRDTPVVVLRGDLMPAAVAAVAHQSSRAVLSHEGGRWTLLLVDPDGGSQQHEAGADSGPAAARPADPSADLASPRWTDELAMIEPPVELIDRLVAWIGSMGRQARQRDDDVTATPGSDSDVRLHRITRRTGPVGREVAMINNTAHYAVVDWSEPGTPTALTSGTVLRHLDPERGDDGGFTVQVPPGGVAVMRHDDGGRLVGLRDEED